MRDNAIWTLFLFWLSTTLAHAQSECGNFGDLKQGTHDYRVEKGRTLGVVEDFHFNPDVESLKRGQTGPLGADIAYVLTQFPNHHRALISMMNLALRDKQSKPVGAKLTIQCYLQRAEAFAPDDASVKVIQGIYLMKTGKPAPAVGRFEAAKAIDGSDPNIDYNLGLAYLEVGRVDDAVAAAQRAYVAGFPLPGLREKLRHLRKWKDPEPPTRPSSQ